MIQPNKTQLFKTLLANAFIACEWNLDFLEANFAPNSFSYQEHSSVQTELAALGKPIKLEACFELFSRPDTLEAHCATCKKSSKFSKKMQLANLPPVLILHLKRFKVTPQ